jgi:hypothetical protein
MPRKKKPDPAQMPLLELSLKITPCVSAIRQEVRESAGLPTGCAGYDLTQGEWEAVAELVRKRLEKAGSG